MPVTQTAHSGATYLVGGGIASLAAAAFLIRDGDIPGHTITILEESSRIGGSLDAAGNDTDGYVMRGGRMIESKYLCTYDLFASIPTLDESDGDPGNIRLEQDNEDRLQGALVSERSKGRCTEFWVKRESHSRA